MRPGSFPRRVLLAVSGLSPQIVTETLYALAVAAPEEERFVPTDVEVITTAVGATRIQRELIGSAKAAFHRLVQDYQLGPIRFTANQIHTVKGGDGQALADIRTAEDNSRLADTITARVRELTADQDCALHVSLAGGRKTMGFYAGYALSLFGRPQDSLSHVLVSEPFESAADFWYPRPQPELVRVRVLSDAGPNGAFTQEKLSTAAAQVSLAHIPFVRMREGLPKALLEGREGFAATVAAAGAAVGPPRLTLHMATREVEADGQRIALQPAPFAFYAALASRAAQGRAPLRAPHKEVHDPGWAQEVLDDMRHVFGLMHLPLGVEASLTKDCSGLRVSPMVSRLRRALAQQLAPGRLGHYFDDGGQHRHKRYSVPLPASAIRLIRPGERPNVGRGRRGKLAEHAPIA